MRSTLEQRKKLGSSKDQAAKEVMADLVEAEKHLRALISVVGPAHPIAADASYFLEREGPLY